MCGSCSRCVTYPSAWVVIVAGFTNGGGCNCTIFNGTWMLDGRSGLLVGGDCAWRYEISSGYDIDIVFNPAQCRYEMKFTSGACGVVALYYVDDDNWNCCGTNNWILASSN